MARWPCLGFSEFDKIREDVVAEEVAEQKAAAEAEARLPLYLYRISKVLNK